jgi:hypothetical protein
MIQSKISKSIIENLTLTWDMINEAIITIPKNQWRAGDNEYLIPAKIMLHTLQTLDFYTSKDPNNFTPLHKFQIDKNSPPSQYPNQKQLEIYMKNVKEQFESWIKGLKDSDFHLPEEVYPWTGSTILGRVLYSLEHTRQHFGELNAELRRRNLPRIKWKTHR